jgi:phosphoribosyl-ATP pyrophosphohydrolase/phosphoribosyl-AMP cyclohydrolase
MQIAELTMTEVHRIRFDDEGLVPTVVQDWRDGTVLMVGFMNQEALDRTVETKHVHFWSRSRKALWEKGETSGHYLVLKDLFLDCDLDTVLVKAEPVGPTCHTGEPSCFFTRLTDDGAPDAGKTVDALGGVLERIYRTILDRKQVPQRGSYVTSLFEGGVDRILKKVVEEAGEVVLGAKNAKREELVREVADLFFHTLIVLGYHGITPQEVYQELANRLGKSGLRSEKTKGGRPGE